MSKSLVYRTSVDPAWIDHNGHMNVAYFVLAFDQATDAAYEHWNIGEKYPATSGCSVFTLGMNVDYFGELFSGENIRVETTLVDYDQKRIHYVHEMFNETSASLAASNECLCMNVNLDTRKSATFPDDVLGQLENAVDHEAKPTSLGRVLAIRRNAQPRT